MTNPYAPPQAIVADIADPLDRLLLADRGTRLGAAFLDGLIFAGMVYLPLVLALVAGGAAEQEGDGAIALIGFSLAGLGLVAWIWLTVRYVLRNGDTVEILTSPNQKPNKDWLKYCTTSSAKAKIRTYLRTEQRERSRALGRELLERELKKYGYAWSKVEKSGDLDRAAEQLKNSSAADLLTSVGYGRLLPSDVVEKIIPEEKRRALVDNPPSENPVVNLLRSVVAPKRPSKSSAGIKVAGEDDVMVRFAKCCAPVPGDPIVGFISVGRGVTIHQLGCRKAMDLDPARRIEVEWDGEQKSLRPVSIQVVSADKPGILASLSQSFNDLGVNISQANCRAMDDNKALNTFSFGVRDLEQLKSVMRALQRVSGVYSVTRM